jgi:hypothetical protein
MQKDYRLYVSFGKRVAFPSKSQNNIAKEKMQAEWIKRCNWEKETPKFFVHPVWEGKILLFPVFRKRDTEKDVTQQRDVQSDKTRMEWKDAEDLPWSWAEQENGKRKIPSEETLNEQNVRKEERRKSPEKLSSQTQFPNVFISSQCVSFLFVVVTVLERLS